jgi:hypothetical protein
MAFFDCDHRIQTLLIACALASSTACGSTTDISGGSDARSDADVTVDTGGDTSFDTPLDTWNGPEIVDPPPDVLDPDVHGVCPDPETWSVHAEEAGWDYPEMTLRVRLDVPVEFIDESTPEFTVEKKSIDAVREISPDVYEVDYRWFGPLEHTWWDWDRFDVSWRVRCVDAAGVHERLVSTRHVICIGEGYMWLSSDTDPELACMVVDCVPESMGHGSARDGAPSPSADASPADVPEILPRGALDARVVSTGVTGGAVGLKARASGFLAEGAAFEWRASSGRLEVEGDTATWHPPSAPGVHTVQVVARAGAALSVAVYRFTTR